MEKIWLKSYPPGMPAEINPDAYQSIIEVFEQSCRTHAQADAFYSYGVRLTYHQVDQLSRHFAAYLQQVLQLKKGDRLAIMLPNALQYPVAMFGALRAGLIVVNVNPMYTSDELTHQLNDAEADAIVVMDFFAHTVQKAKPQLLSVKQVIVTNLCDLFPPVKAWLMRFVMVYIYKQIKKWSIPDAISFKTVIAKGATLPLVPVTITNQDIAFLQYTGGTTGISKGAVLTHRNIVANIQQADAWFKFLLDDRDEIIITALPLYHVFSLMANCLYFIKLGGLNVLITNPRDIPEMIKIMRKFKFTAITGVNTLFNALLKNSEFKKLDFSHLRLALGGGMAIQQVVAENWQAVTGVPLLEGYGLSETSPCVSITPTNQPQFTGSIGLPVPSTDIQILDNSRHPLPLNQPGELAVKGPQVMQGYWRNPKETANVFTPDGWLLTGDIAVMDDQGYIRLLERKKDMILVSGFNVYPNEIENVIAKMPGVREVAVVGVVDENSGEAPKAFIVRDNPGLDSQQVIAYCRKHLTAYKIPKYVEFCQDLPKTNVGKVLRRQLKMATQF